MKTFIIKYTVLFLLTLPAAIAWAQLPPPSGDDGGNSGEDDDDGGATTCSLTGGTISNAQTLCYASNPSQINNSSVATNGNSGESIGYSWQQSTNGSSWSTISGALSTYYDPPTLYTTTYYRRRATSCGATAYSNTITITIYEQLTGGSIGNAQTVCYGGNPSTISNTATPSGGNNSKAYQWQHYINGSWTNISGATGTTYDPPTLYTTTQYRRRVENCGATAYSNTITISVWSDLSAGTISGSQTICSGGDPATLSNSSGPSGSNSSYAYQWQSRPPGGSWANISGATSSTYNPPVLTSTTEYRRQVTSCSITKSSNTITVTVIALPTPPPTPSVSTNTCGDKTVTLPSDSDGTVYWQTTSGGTSTQDRASTKTISTSTTLYVRTQSSAGCWSGTTAVNVTVNPYPQTPTAAPAVSDNVCGAKTLTLPAAPTGVTYYWQTSSSGTATDATAAASTYTVGEDGTNTVYYRASSSAGCWSSGAYRLDVNVINAPTSLPDQPGQDHRISDQVTLTRGTPPDDGQQWLWQETADGTSTTAEAVSETLIVYETKSVWLRSQNGECWGPALEIPVTVQHAPFINGVSTTAILVPEVTDLSQVEALNVYEKSRGSSYMDGLGRTVQSVAWQASPGQQDVVHAMTYDHRGRAQKQYLPYVSQGTDGKYRSGAISGTYENSEQYQFYQSTPDIAHDPQPYAETRYETSPMSRMLEQSAIGSDWDLNSGHTSKVDFRIATAATDDTIYLWTLQDGLPVANFTYAGASLMVSEVEDADQHRVRTYTDKVGKTILKRGENGSEDRDTYYVYNTSDQLVYIIPPKEAYELTHGTTITATYAANRLYHYTYDARGRTRTKETPDAGEVRYVYDQYDRVVLTQDANQRSKSVPEWSFVKYDALNRPVMAGTYATTTSWETLEAQAYANGHVTKDITGTYDDTQAYPTTSTDDVLSISYYDQYEVAGLSEVTYQTAFDGFFATPSVPDLYVYGSATRSQTRVLGSDIWLHTVSFSDEYGRTIQVQRDNHKGGTDVMTMAYDFAGRLLRTVSFYNNPHATDLTEVKTMTYDHAGRLLALDHQLNDDPPVRLASFEYNELGQVISKGLHGDAVPIEPVVEQEGALYGEDIALDAYNGEPAIIASNSIELLPGFTTEGYDEVEIKVATLPGGNVNEVVEADFTQKVDYAYNIRGWLKSINDAQLNSENDLFGLELLYNDASGGHEKYTGIIGEVKWKGAQDEVTKSYRYTYDALNQLTQADYGENDSYATNMYGIANLDYDLNGNIQAIERNGMVAGTQQLVDDLDFTYEGNQLMSVDDLTTYEDAFNDRAETADEYDYDANGNMVKDLNKEMTSVVYNHLNLAKEVSFADGRQVKYGYSAGGQLLWQEFYDASQQLTLKRDFLGGQVFENDVLVSLETGEGRIVPVANGDTDEGGEVAFDYQYNLKDHQGNTRVTFSTTPENYETIATMEDSNESTYFSNYHPEVDEVAAYSGTHVSRAFNDVATNGLDLNTFIRVNKGDTVRVDVRAYYDDDDGSYDLAAGVIEGALFGAFNPAAVGEGVNVTQSTFDEAFGASTALGGRSATTTVPQAFVNYIFFDQDMNYEAAGFKQISSAAYRAHEHVVADDFIADREGYLLVYLSNETESDVVVSFDDLNVYHGKTHVVQANDYYPFGLSSTSYTRTASLFNPYLYNQGSRLEEETDWYHTPFRKYDAALTRFTGVDPMASSMASINSYHYAYNNPVNFSDPAGLTPRKGGVPIPTAETNDNGSRRGGGGFRVPGFSATPGIGRMGWSNGTGYNADGSVHYGTYHYSTIEEMATDAYNSTKKDGAKTFFYEDGALIGTITHNSNHLASKLREEINRNDYWSYGKEVNLSVNSYKAYSILSIRALFNWQGFMNDYIHAADFGQASFYFPEKGDLVAAPLEGWDNVWDFFSGRTYVDDLGTTWNVGRDGKIIGLAPVTGTELGLAGGAGVVKGAKWAAKMLRKYPNAKTAVKQIGNYWKHTVNVPGNTSGYTVYTKYVNAQGKTVKFFHDTFDTTGKFLHRGWAQGSQRVHQWWDGFVQTVGPYIPR